MLTFTLKSAYLRARLPRISRSKDGWGRRIVKWLLLITGLLIGAEAAHVLFFGNIHEIIPGRVYRSAQLSPTELRRLIEQKGIRTVINLRGCCMPFEWYVDECKTTHDLNVSQEDVTFSAIRLPAPSEVRQLIEVLDRSEQPIVFHCRQGADRTGMTAAIVMLLYTDADLATARIQCSPRYAHFRALATAKMDEFFDMYEDWLNRSGLSHDPDHFRDWALNQYRPDPAPARIELLSAPKRVEPGDAPTIVVRAHNLSRSTWEFKTGTVTGIYVRTVVATPKGQAVAVVRAGRIEARVAPGESIDVSVALPVFHEQGAHRIVVDLADRHLNFCQLGSDWLDFEIQVGALQGR